jgi:hypothetical protein
VFSGDRPKDFKFITEAADRDENIRTPASANVNDDMRRLIPLTPEWTFWPDFDRVRPAAAHVHNRARDEA